MSQLKAAVSAPFLKLPHRISATADLTKHVTASGIRSDLAASFMNRSVVGENDSLLRWNMVFNKDCRTGNQGIRSWPGSATDLLWDLGASHFTSLDLSLFAKKTKKWGCTNAKVSRLQRETKCLETRPSTLPFMTRGALPVLLVCLPSAEDTPSGVDTAKKRLFSTVVTCPELGSTL